MSTAQIVRRTFVMSSPLFCMVAMYSYDARADNPIVQTNYTADPAPMVYDGRLYVHTTHDEDVTVNGFFTMNDWRVYSTVDMVNWTDHGSPLSYKSFTWGTGDAWAGQCIPRNGKFYFYVPLNNSTGTKIGVAVSNSPTGPFTDPLGKALISTGSGNIDPTVFIDDDGQAYLYWGNPDLWYVKLNADMISYSGSPTKVSLTTAGFGTRTNTDRATAYEEGPWFYKRGTLYYIVYPADGTPEKISYTTSSGPLGPWTYRGDIMAKQTGTGASFTNHPGVVDYMGKSYFFYHNGALPGGGGYKRSVCIEEFTYNADGTIPTIKMSTAGPNPVATLNPYALNEAETIAFSAGLKTEVCSEGGMDVTSISAGDYIKVKNVDFGTAATSFTARVAASASGGSIQIRTGSQTGTLVGTCTVPATGGAQVWTNTTCTISGASGTKDLFFVFSGGSFNFNNWQFTGSGSGTAGAAGASSTGGASATGGNSARGGTGTVGGNSSTTGGSKANGGGLATGGALTSGGGGSGGSGTTGGTSNSSNQGGASIVAATGGRVSAGGSLTATGGLASNNGGSVNTSGGNNALGSQANTGGVYVSGGAQTLGGTTGAPTTDASDSGCSCQVVGANTQSKPLALLTLLGLAMVRSGRRTKRQVA